MNTGTGSRIKVMPIQNLGNLFSQVRHKSLHSPSSAYKKQY